MLQYRTSVMCGSGNLVAPPNETFELTRHC
jgi:hypothetical protein